MKYICDKCNFITINKTSFETHCQTNLHKMGKRKERSDKKELYKCVKCNYKTKSERNYQVHILNNHASNDERKKGFKYYCEECDFGINYEPKFVIHKNSLKHKRKLGENN